MSELIAFRPRMGVEKLKALSKKMDYPNVSRFIEDAILEKVHREVHLKKNPEIQKLSEEIGKLIMKHLGVRWSTPGSSLEKEIRKKPKTCVPEKMKSHQWKGSLKQFLNDTQSLRTALPHQD